MGRVGPSYDVLQAQTFRQLQTLPNVGPATAGDLIRLGVSSLDDLSRRDPRALYDRLTQLDGAPRDPGVLDTFAAAVHAARTGETVPWWEPIDLRTKVDHVQPARGPLRRPDSRR